MGQNRVYKVFTDGSCDPNPGRGGWAAIIFFGRELVAELGGNNAATTNNRMEIQAAVEALKYIDDHENVEMYCDSEYLKNGITKWVIGWQRNGWKTADGNPVKNKDLWLDLIEQAERKNIHWKWVKGHAGHVQNEQADKLAKEMRNEFEDVVRMVNRPNVNPVKLPLKNKVEVVLGALLSGLTVEISGNMYFMTEDYEIAVRMYNLTTNEPSQMIAFGLQRLSEFITVVSVMTDEEIFRIGANMVLNGADK